MLKAKRIRPQQKRNIIQNGFGFLNKYRLLSQGSNFNVCRNYSMRVHTGVKGRKHQDYLVDLVCPSMKSSSTQSQN